MPDGVTYSMHHERVNVIDWLLDSDPAIRWQVMRDLTDAPADVVAAERAKVATEGWGAQLLALQPEDGVWSGGAYVPEWTSTTPTLQLLRHFGLDPKSPDARRALALVRANARWEYDDLPYFDGEVEPCINGQAVAIGAYFGQDIRVIVDRLLTEQMEDGGWNCEQENGSTRGSFETTINVLEGLLEFERATGGNPDVTAAGVRGQEYLLERRLLRRLSTGELAQPRWLYLCFPNGWHYDVLRVLDYLRDAGVAPDERTAEAIGIVESKRDADGRLDTAEPLAFAAECLRWMRLKKSQADERRPLDDEAWKRVRERLADRIARFADQLEHAIWLEDRGIGLMYRGRDGGQQEGMRRHAAKWLDQDPTLVTPLLKAAAGVAYGGSLGMALEQDLTTDKYDGLNEVADLNDVRTAVMRVRGDAPVPADFPTLRYEHQPASIADQLMLDQFAWQDARATAPPESDD